MDEWPDVNDRDAFLSAKARAAVKAAKLPFTTGSGWGGTLQEPRGYMPAPILCGVCGFPVKPRDISWRLDELPGHPEMHYPECLNAWQAATRCELHEMFNGEDFHAGDPETGEGVLIWASLPVAKRVRFFLKREILMDVLACQSAFANDAALARCREMRPSIEFVCRLAITSRPDNDRIELQPHDFR